MNTPDVNRPTTADPPAPYPRAGAPDASPPLRSPDTTANDGGKAAMFSPDELNHLRPAWSEIQTRFIDEPRKSVEDADALVASTVHRLAESFADERAKLESQWAKGSDVSTEDLRLSLRRYRSFFDRLLSA